MASFPSHDTAMGGGTMCERRHRKAEHTEEWEQTSPLSARHIAGVMLAEKSGVECARGRYLWDFTLVISPISRHPKSAYASQGLWRGLGGDMLTLPVAHRGLCASAHGAPF